MTIKEFYKRYEKTNDKQRNYLLGWANSEFVSVWQLKRELDRLQDYLNPILKRQNDLLELAKQDFKRLNKLKFLR